MKQCWKDRSTNLNSRPVPGVLAEFPHLRLPGNLEDMVSKALCSDFTSLSITIHRSINREPRIDVNIHKVIKFFGPPHFKLRLQNYIFGEGYNQYK